MSHVDLEHRRFMFVHAGYVIEYICLCLND